MLGCLKPKMKNKLIQQLVFYIFQNYSMYPKVDDIILVSNATVKFFDKLQDDQGDIVSVTSYSLFINSKIKSNNI